MIKLTSEHIRQIVNLMPIGSRPPLPLHAGVLALVKATWHVAQEAVYCREVKLENVTAFFEGDVDTLIESLST